MAFRSVAERCWTKQYVSTELREAAELTSADMLVTVTYDGETHTA